MIPVVVQRPATLGWSRKLAGIEQLASDTAQLGVQAKKNDYKATESITTSARTTRQKLTEIDTRDGFTYCGRTS